MNRDGLCGVTEKRPEKVGGGVVNLNLVCELQPGHLGQHMTHSYGYWARDGELRPGSDPRPEE